MTTSDALETLEVVLQSIVNSEIDGWLYLPARDPWGLKCICLIAETPDMPDSEADEWLPDLAKQRNLQRTLPVSVVQDIVINAKLQRPDASLRDLFRAFIYYYDHDAFINFEHTQLET